MKIVLKYQAPGTNIKGYKFSAIYNESEIREALEELYGARKFGYEIIFCALVHDEDAERIAYN